jgi:hypothetical protein
LGKVARPVLETIGNGHDEAWPYRVVDTPDSLE